MHGAEIFILKSAIRSNVNSILFRFGSITIFISEQDAR